MSCRLLTHLTSTRKGREGSIGYQDKLTKALTTNAAGPFPLLCFPRVTISHFSFATPVHSTRDTGIRFCRKSPAVGSMERQRPLGSRMETPEKARVAVASRRWACAAAEGWRVPPRETGTGVVGLEVEMPGAREEVLDLDLVLAWALVVDVAALVFAPALVVEVVREEDVVSLVFVLAVVVAAVCLADVPLVFAAALVEVELVLLDLVRADLVFTPTLAVVELEVAPLVPVPVVFPVDFVAFDFVLVVTPPVAAPFLTLDEFFP